MFTLIGIGTLIYTGYSAWRGEVFAKSGWRGRVVSRLQSPEYFWIVIVSYTALGVALLAVF